MRRSLLASLLLAASLVAGAALVGPSAAQEAPTGSAEGEGGGKVAYLHITKVVDGDGPTGGYVIEYSCVGGDREAPEGGIGEGGSLAFDAAGPGHPETQTIELHGPGICTVTETDSNGATSTTYECEFVVGLGPAAPDGGFDEASTEGFEPGACIDDQSGTITAPLDEMTVTVTNQFDPEVLPDDDEPPAVEPDVVAATPSFTG